MHVALQVGQCGNQLGSEFFKAVANTVCTKNSQKFLDDAKEKFFSEAKSDGKLFARAILIDTEPKVIREALRQNEHSSSFSYHKSGTFIKREGAANNWAMGYFEHGSDVHESALNLVQKEVERCDYLDSFLMFMSIAGGTGSGLGTYLTEMLKDEFPSVPLLNLVVWPFQRGEVTVQSYNSLFTLSHLQNCSDSLILFENDQLFKICTQRIRLKDVSLNDLNVIASQQIASLLFPSKLSSGLYTQTGDILAHLVPHPQFKIVNLRLVPQEPPACRSYSTYTWKSLLRSLRRMLLYNSIVEECVPSNEQTAKNIGALPVSISNLLLLRGIESESVDTECFHQPSLPYASWVPSTSRLKTLAHPASLFESQRIAMVANNGQTIIPCIDKEISKSWKMFSFKAYLHHYNQYGLTNEDFLNCFTVVEQLIASYKSLTPG